MDATELIVELARQIEAQQAAHQIRYWASVAVVSFLFGAAGSFVSEYFKKRGETKAIQADLETIIAQQKELTGAVGYDRRSWPTVRPLADGYLGSGCSSSGF